jgi:hypothetical protein
LARFGALAEFDIGVPKIHISDAAPRINFNGLQYFAWSVTVMDPVVAPFGTWPSDRYPKQREG